MNWDDPLVRAAVNRRMNSMFQYDVATEPALRASWADFYPGWRASAADLNPGWRVSEEELRPAEQGYAWRDPTYFLPRCVRSKIRARMRRESLLEYGRIAGKEVGA